MADRIEAVAIDGLGEIVPGDDLPALIADALGTATHLLPLRDDDVLARASLRQHPQGVPR